mmetsp:Transcript_21221/g.51935  ORF Transcript_21221/g.51935 Transcript_21221/m.51935 type:complete len:222 (-) Transcript_21221:450-1115(-)
MRWAAWRRVTMLPPTTSSLGKLLLIHLIICSWYMESPCEESITTRSTPASTRAATRFLSLGRVPMVAPTRSCLLAFLEALGKSRCLRRSLRDIRATRSPFLLVMKSLEALESMRTLLSCWSSLWSSSKAVMSLSAGLITCSTGVSRSSTKSMSAAETRPRSLDPSFPFCVMGMPQNPYWALIRSTSEILAPGARHFGSVMKPFLKRLTSITSRDCSSMELL